MSESLTIPAHTDTVSRQVRRDRPDRQARYEPETPETTIEVADGPSPEAIIADGARQLQEKDREVAESRRIAREAQQREQAARREVEQARANQVTDRQAIIAQALEGAVAEQRAARATIRSARDAGDVDAEMSAVEALSAATFRVTQATAELEAAKSMRAAQPQQTQQQSAYAPSPEAQKWLDEHPRYNTDRVYRGAAHEAHNEAVRQGMPSGSPQYIDYIERVMTAEFGENHGQAQSGGRSQPVPNERDRGPSARDGVPPSRGAGGGVNGGFQQVRTALHKDPVMVQRGANGSMKIRFSSTEQQKDFQEGADTCRMSLADYVLDHINVADEISAGGSGDLVRGEGAKFE